MALEGILQGQRVHHRGQHADVVGLRAIHALGRTGQAAEDVAAAHDHGHLHAGAHDFGDLIGKVVHHLRIDAVATSPASASPDNLSSTRS